MSHKRLVIAAALLAGAAGADAQTSPTLEATAQAMLLAGGPACGQPGKFSSEQLRLLQKASQGVEPLRQYVHRTRGVYQYDMAEIGGWIGAWRADQERCDEVQASKEKR